MEYDLTHPVDFYVYIGGAHTLRELSEKVFGPGRQILNDFAATQPGSITAYHDLQFRREIECKPRNEIVSLHVIDHKKRVVYLGDLLAIDASKQRLERAVCDCDDDDTELHNRLVMLNPTRAIICDRFTGYTLGSRSRQLKQSNIEGGLRRFLRILCPPLCSLPINWLSQSEATKLENIVDDLVEQRAAYLGENSQRRARRNGAMRERNEL